MKCWKGPECKIRIRDPHKRQQLRLKIENISEVRQEDFRTGICEANNQEVQRVAENEDLDLVEGSAPSEADDQGLGIFEGPAPTETVEESLACLA
jgi:hypothetical protein